MTPGLQDRLCFTVTMTGAYGSAAEVALKWGCGVEASTLHQLVQRIGNRAQEQVVQRIKTPAVESSPQRAPSRLGVLQADGWLVRHRGPGWGWKKTQQKRIEWHEMKMGVYYPLEQAVERQAGRAQLVEKVVVSTLGEAVELGEQLHWEALRRGLARARDLEMLGDGAHWIWHLKQHRWAGAVEVLDFYHGSEHVWALGRALKGEQQAKEWVEPLLQQLRQGQERKVLRQIARLRVPRGERGQRVRKEQSYFAGQEHRMNYQQLAARGWPIGSGAVESACRQRQCRFKRPGQFWTAHGLRNLCALEQARHNHHWEELWNQRGS